jgi:hypothetical protein
MLAEGFKQQENSTEVGVGSKPPKPANTQADIGDLKPARWSTRFVIRVLIA